MLNIAISLVMQSPLLLRSLLVESILSEQTTERSSGAQEAEERTVLNGTGSVQELQKVASTCQQLISVIRTHRALAAASELRDSAAIILRRLSDSGVRQTALVGSIAAKVA